MSKVLPYIILNIQLEEHADDTFFPLIQTSAYYCLFWWKCIPLGHLFIERGSNLSKQNFKKEMLKVIMPTLAFYAHQTGKGQVESDHAFDGHSASLAGIMNDIFASYIPDSLPGQVDVSIVICTRNRSHSLKRCLDIILKQKCHPREIIVIDNAPSDNSTFEVASQYRNKVMYCKEPRPGLDIARNTGAGKASAAVIAYIDDDVLVHPFWTYHVWQTFNDPKVAAMTGLVLPSSLDTESQQIFEKFWSFNRGYQDKFFDHSFYEDNLASGPPVWEIGAGANMAFRKSIFREAGYFDERLDVGAAGCSGDSEIWYRILAKGFNIYYNPRAVVCHEHRKEIEALHNQIFHYMRGHAAAALIQQAQNEAAGYRKRLFRVLPKYYMHSLAEGFPFYNLRYKTLFSEIRGLASGILFYRKHRKSPSHIHPH